VTGGRSRIALDLRPRGPGGARARPVRGPTGPPTAFGQIVVAPGLEPIIGADLLALIRERSESLVSLTEVSALPSPVRRRAAFRLEFAGGLTLKGRRLESAARASRIERFLGLGLDGFPRVLSRRGDALLIEWVEGRVLSALDPVPPAVLEQCGRMLGALHRLEAPEWLGVRSLSPEDSLAKLQMAAGLLSAAGELDRHLARMAVEAAAAARPRRVSGGITHKDFCAENIVLGPSRGPVSVDNGTVSFGPLDLDLARTWCRWPLSAADWQHFLRGYSEFRSHAGFAEHFAFWVIAALVASASSRLHSGTGHHREPLERLRRLLELREGDRRELTA
jgi:hypothetical protein